MIAFAFTIIIIIIAILYLWPSRKKVKIESFPDKWNTILLSKVHFYFQLNDSGRKLFRYKILTFLNSVHITGIDTEVNDCLRLLVASSAIIPVFYFKRWDYPNLSEVLIYNGLVETYQLNEKMKQDILGQVRPFQTKHLLLLSKQSLEKAFEKLNVHHVGIHEFAHLIDQADGDIDGFPKLIFSPDHLKVWCHLMLKEIEKIKKGKSDVNPYGISSRAEFFAVVCEYFFGNPEKFRFNHPLLFNLLSNAFQIPIEAKA